MVLYLILGVTLYDDESRGSPIAAAASSQIDAIWIEEAYRELCGCDRA